MSRTTLSPAKRGVAGLTAAALTFGTLGLVVTGGSASAAGETITVSTVKIANPDPKAAKTTPLVDGKGPFNGTGDAVQIVGTHFPATPTVTFDGVAATKVIRISATQLIAKAPAKTVATTDDAVDVVVGDTVSSGNGGNTAGTKTDGYTYKAAPVLTDAKYSTDFKSLEITGTNLADVNRLQLGPLSVVPKSGEATATKITVKVPSALTKAKYDVTATSPWGSGTLGSSWSVRPVGKAILSATPTASTGKYDAVKFADSLAPNRVVKITGTALGSVDSVHFGFAAAEFIASSDTELVVVVPAMSATQTTSTETPNKGGVVKVPVTIKNGTLAAAKPLSFEYRLAPIVTSIGTAATPTIVGNVTVATATVVTFTGQNLLGTKLYFGTGSGVKTLAPKSGGTATSVQFTMPNASGGGLTLGTAYDLWLVSKGGNLNTGRKITVSSGS